MRANPDHYSGRRLAIAAVSNLFLPVGIKESPALSQANQLLASDHGLVIAIPHFSKGDFFRVLGALFNLSPKIREREVLIPIAEHQRHFRGLAGMASYTNIQLSPIVTPDTKAREEEKLRIGKKIPWQVNDEGFGLLGYSKKARKILTAGGVVLVAPQQGRRSVLDPFEGHPFQALDGAGRSGAKVAHLFAGIEIPGVRDYGKHPGYNFLRKYLVSFGEETFTRGKLIARAEGHGRTIDQEAYQIMLDLAPPSYRPGYL